MPGCGSRRLSPCLLGFGLLALACATLSPTPPSPTAPAIWRPVPGTTWQIQYTGELDLSFEVEVYNLDLFDTDPATVAALRADGRRVRCYLSAGSWEDWRPDAGAYPADVRGHALAGWPGEQWLDVRRLDVLGPLLEARLDLCRAKGFDGADPDNVDGFTHDTGFPLTAGDQLAFNRFLAQAAHARGLSIGLKNDLSQVADLVDDFDWALNEQCFAYDECELLLPFIEAGKPVFNIEYDLLTAEFCPQAAALGFSALRKNLSLDAYREACPEVP